MFIVYFALWIIFNGRWTTEVAVFGLIFAAVFYAFSCLFLDISPKKDWGMIRKLPEAVSYGANLINEVVRANLAVIRMILDRKFEPDPQLVHFSSGLESKRHRVALADSITLTPGTITCNLKADEFLVHCLDRSLMEGLETSSFVTRLTKIEQGEPEADAPKSESALEEAPVGEVLVEGDAFTDELDEGDSDVSAASMDEEPDVHQEESAQTEEPLIEDASEVLTVEASAAAGAGSTEPAFVETGSEQNEEIAEPARAEDLNTDGTDLPEEGEKDPVPEKEADAEIDTTPDKPEGDGGAEE